MAALQSRARAHHQHQHQDDPVPTEQSVLGGDARYAAASSRHRQQQQQPGISGNPGERVGGVAGDDEAW